MQIASFAETTTLCLHTPRQTEHEIARSGHSAYMITCDIVVVTCTLPPESKLLVMVGVGSLPVVLTSTLFIYLSVASLRS